MKTNKINDEYEQQTYEVCKKRIVLAGMRMANLVLSIYQSELGESSSI